MIAIADTETTGFPKPGAAIQPGQARVCQLAVLLCDDDGKHMTEFSTLIRLDEDTAMNIRAQEVHGISWDMCNKYGMSQRQAIDATLDIMCKADKVVFHNKKFDLQMLAIEVAYAGFLMPYINGLSFQKHYLYYAAKKWG
jgi:DNA polymerase III epsilon subunit-like protein